MSSNNVDWDASKQDALDKIKQLPGCFSDDEIIEQYQQLLDALQEPDVKAMDMRVKQFAMHERFETFALSYSYLFNCACRREQPLPVDEIKKMLQLSKIYAGKNITEDETYMVLKRLAIERKKGLKN